MSLHDASYFSLDFSAGDLGVSASTRRGEPKESADSPPLHIAAREPAGGRVGGAQLHVAPQRRHKTMAPRRGLALVALLASQCHGFFSSGRTCEIESCNT